jgi:peptide/nickel transport system permease protein
VTAWLARRLTAAAAGVWAVVTLTFILIHLAPGDPFRPGPERAFDPGVAEALERQFGLDRPLLVQYVLYFRELGRGNLGVSFAHRRPVADAFAEAIPNTLVLAGAALVIDFLIGLALGVYQAARARRAPDIALGNITLFLSSVPTFWLGLILLVVFGQWLGWFPIGGPHDPVMHASFSWFGRLSDRLWHLALPALTLGLVGAAGTARYQRAAMLEALSLDFVRTARAKGASETRVLLRHALRNALLPIITLFGLAFPFLLTGAVLTERIFAWPGMGWLAADAILARDYPVVTAAALVAAVMVAAGSLLADLLLAAADPRILTVDA